GRRENMVSIQTFRRVLQGRLQPGRLCATMSIFARREIPMQRELLPLLVCPKCRGDLSLTETQEVRGKRIWSGTLTCDGCHTAYPVELGIPRLVEAPADVQTIGRRFEFEWVTRWTGGFENTARCHGMDLNEYVTWHKDRLTEQ